MASRAAPSDIGAYDSHGTSTTVTASPNPSAVGQTVTFTAVVTARLGNFDYGGTVQFAVDGSNFGSPQSINSMGVAAIQDSKLSAGTHTITATYSGDSSFTASSGTLSCGLVVVGPVSLSRSTISATPASVAVNGKVTVTLTARDANGNQELGGGLTVAFGLTTGSAGGSFGTVTDNKNGTYTATFTATKVGSDTITATIGGAAVTSTPPIVKVTSSSASLSQSTVTVSSGSVAVGGKITVALTAQDDHGNQQLKGGLAVKFVLASGKRRGHFRAGDPPQERDLHGDIHAKPGGHQHDHREDQRSGCYLDSADGDGDAKSGHCLPAAPDTCCRGRKPHEWHIHAVGR